MNMLYKIGIVIGIVAIYSLITWGLGAMFSDNDDIQAAAVAWATGAIAFLILAIFTMEKLGLWTV
jgi:hypothetical protein